MTLRIDAIVNHDDDDDDDTMAVSRLKLGPFTLYEAVPYAPDDGLAHGQHWPTLYGFSEAKVRSACWVWMLTQEGLE